MIRSCNICCGVFCSFTLEDPDRHLNLISSSLYYPSIKFTGVCLVVAVGLTQDLKLILSTKKHQTKQNKTKKTKPTQEFIYCKRKWRRIHCEEYMLCVTASNNILENAICHGEAMMKICCVLLPASLWRTYSCVLFTSSAVYFYQCVYQIECLRCQVPSWRVCMSGTC